MMGMIGMMDYDRRSFAVATQIRNAPQSLKSFKNPVHPSSKPLSTVEELR